MLSAFQVYFLLIKSLAFRGSAIRKAYLSLSLPMPCSPPDEHQPNISVLWGYSFHSCKNRPLTRQWSVPLWWSAHVQAHPFPDRLPCDCDKNKSFCPSNLFLIYIYNIALMRYYFVCGCLLSGNGLHNRTFCWGRLTGGGCQQVIYWCRNINFLMYWCLSNVI